MRRSLFFDPGRSDTAQQADDVKVGAQRPGVEMLDNSGAMQPHGDYAVSFEQHQCLADGRRTDAERLADELDVNAVARAEVTVEDLALHVLDDGPAGLGSLQGGLSHGVIMAGPGQCRQF